MQNTIQNKKYKNSLSLFLMIVITTVTQVLTVVKSSLVAGSFGAGMQLDAYNFSNSITSFLFGIVGAGIPTVIMPEYVKNRDRKNVDGFLTVIYLLLFAALSAILLLRYRIVGLFASRGEMFANLVCNILLVLAFAQYLSSVAEITTAYFQCKGIYNIPKIINLLSQSLVVGLLVIFRGLNIYQYTFIVSGGMALNFAVNITFALIKGWRFKPRFVKNEETMRLLKIFLPTVLSSGVYKLSTLVDSAIAASLEEGMLTILSYSDQIVTMVNSLLIGNLLIFAYPKIIRHLDENRTEGQKHFWEQTNLFHAVVCLVICGFAAVGFEGVSLLFQHGKLDEAAAWGIYIGSTIYIVGQQTNVVRDMIYRYFYAVGNTKTPAKNSIVISVVNIVLSLILVYFMGFYGIILGTVISSLVSLVMIMIKFGRFEGYGTKPVKICLMYAKNLAVGVFTCAAVFATKYFLGIDNRIVSILVFGTETVVIYAALIILVNRGAVRALKNL